MNQRTRRSPARFLAPLALIAVLIAFMAIVSGSGGGSSSSTGEPTGADTSTSTATTTSSSKKSSATKTGTKKSKTATGGAKSTYTVQAGDTFGTIADKTGLTVEQIQELNPDADPHLLQTGQKIRLK